MVNSRISNRDLGTLCDRVGIAFDVGHDPLRIFEREAQSRNGLHAKKMASITDSIKRGCSITEAVQSQGNYFPGNFNRLVEVGEHTGRLEKVLERLAIYYTEMADLQAAFGSAITWPLIQLGLGLIVVSMLIFLPAYLVPDNPEAADILGIGLSGASGLAIFWCYVAIACGVIWALWWLFRNGKLGFVSEAIGNIPGFRQIITVFDEASFVQALALSVESGLDAVSAVGLSFRSTSSSLFRRKAEVAENCIRAGGDITTAMQQTNLFSKETLEAVHLGEESGRLAETLDKHYRFLQMRARTAMGVITQIASSLVWVAISGILIAVIFRVFQGYAAVLSPGSVESMFERAGGVQSTN